MKYFGLKLSFTREHRPQMRLRLCYFVGTYLIWIRLKSAKVVAGLIFLVFYCRFDPRRDIFLVNSYIHCYHTGIQIHDFFAFEDHSNILMIYNLPPVRY